MPTNFVVHPSGARKSTGSYYTGSNFVEFILKRTIEPAIKEHFNRLDGLDDMKAAKSLFDFRVADIAMGSGHFLIAAIDHIEHRMAEYMAKRELPGIRIELNKLREVAKDALGELGESVTIEDSQLLRRTIARRCIYGVDINHLAVQLARLSVWIHTFVPGLPLSVLNRTLIQGNSLIGIGSWSDIEEVLDRGKKVHPVFSVGTTKEILSEVSEPLNRIASLNDATLVDIASTHKAIRELESTLKPTKDLCDLITSRTITEDKRILNFPYERWRDVNLKAERSVAIQQSLHDLEGLNHIHFPIVFPEVFFRLRSGFDVIVGNPPWEEVKVEERSFWTRHYPGFMSLKPEEQEIKKLNLREQRPDLYSAFQLETVDTNRIRKALVNGGFPGIETGDPDLYQAFCWRFWHLTAKQGGHIGVVLPRNALTAKGSTNFRITMFKNSNNIDVTMLVNNLKWVFPDVHPQYTIGLICVKRGNPLAKSITIRGPFRSLNEFNEISNSNNTVGDFNSKDVIFSTEDVLHWNDTASLPVLPDAESFKIFAQLRQAPRLDLNEPSSHTDGGGYRVARSSRQRTRRISAKTLDAIHNEKQRWRARPHTELHATHQKKIMTFDSKLIDQGYWPVYQGKSFDLWTPDTGIYYAWADPEPVIKWLIDKRTRAGKGNRDSPHREFPMSVLQDRTTLPCYAPRIAFRNVTNRTNLRTIITCLIPPKVFISNAGPYFLWPRGDELDQAFLLGVLSSIPLDWYARRFVEVNVNFFIINPFPIPRPSRTNKLWKRAVYLSGRLASPDERFAIWANKVGVRFGPLDEDEKENLIYELDAVVAHLYDLNEQQLIHIFETFHEGWDYEHRLNEVLRHFRRTQQVNQ